MTDSTATRRVLVTGFEPFGRSTLNPSQQVVQAIEQGELAAHGAQLSAAVLPVDTQRIASVVDRLWRQHEPDIVLHLGESAKAGRLTLERVALNLLDFEIPDNAGRHEVDRSIDPAGPAARFATLPVRLLADGLLEQHGVACDLSLSAGAYLCNQTLYLSLAEAERRGGRAVGFVHVPSLPEQAERGERDGPTMPREQLIEQVRWLVALAAEVD